MAKIESMGDFSPPEETFNTIVGEVPGEGVPGEVLFQEKDVTYPNHRLQNLRKKVRDNRKRIIITVLAGTGIAVGTIGTLLAVRHLIERNPNSDITDL